MTGHRILGCASRATSILALLGLAACGGGGGDGLVTRVPQCTITGVVVQPSATTLTVGEQTTLQSLPSSQNCTTIPAASWASATPSVATVNPSTGLVTAVAPGTAVISVAIGSASGSAVVTVRVPPVASILVSPSQASLQVGQSVTLVAEPRDARGVALTGRTVTWQSATPGVATVNATTGLVTAIAPGTATVTASSEGITQGAAITVTTRPPASILLTVPNPTLTAQQTTQATAVVRDAQDAVLPNETVTWLSTNPAVATVSNTGLITALTPGQTTVRVTSNTSASVTAQAVITVSAGAPASVVVTLVGSLNITQTASATAVVRDAAQNVIANANVTWSSSNTAVASVISSTGVVTGVSSGTATITAAVVGSPAITGSKVITVAAPVTTVTIAQSNVLLEPGPLGGLTSVQLVTTLRDINGNVLTGRAISYVSSNNAVATVSATGLVSAVAVGTGTITVTSEGVSATVPVIVARAFAVIDANQPTNTATYQPPQINSAGSPITVTRTGTGQYRISIAGIGLAATTIGRNFTFLVSGTNSSINSQLIAPSAMCNLMTDASVAGPTTATVLCTDPSSLLPKDAPFRMMVIGDNSVGTTGQGAAFSLHNTFTGSTYTPNANFSWNQAGAGMTVTPGFGAPEWNSTQARHSMGISFDQQYALATTISDTPGVACEVQSQVPSSLFTDVVCWSRAGAVNAIHTVLKLSSGRPGQNGGLAFIDAGTGAYTGQGFNSAGGAVTSARTGTGKYTVTFGGMVATGAIGVMVTPWGSTGYVACSHIVAATNPVRVDVACFNAFGAFADGGAALTVLVLQ